MKITKKEYTTPEEKKKDRRRGFWLWWGINVLMWVITFGLSALLGVGMSSADENLTRILGIANVIIGLLPWVVNLGVLIYLALTRTQMAWGFVLGFASAFALVLVLGVVLAVVCFVIIAASGGGG
jgi:hypothetical protein